MAGETLLQQSPPAEPAAAAAAAAVPEPTWSLPTEQKLRAVVPELVKGRDLKAVSVKELFREIENNLAIPAGALEYRKELTKTIITECIELGLIEKKLRAVMPKMIKGRDLQSMYLKDLRQEIVERLGLPEDKLNSRNARELVKTVFMDCVKAAEAEAEAKQEARLAKQQAAMQRREEAGKSKGTGKGKKRVLMETGDSSPSVSPTEPTDPKKTKTTSLEAD